MFAEARYGDAQILKSKPVVNSPRAVDWTVLRMPGGSTSRLEGS